MGRHASGYIAARLVAPWQWQPVGTVQVPEQIPMERNTHADWRHMHVVGYQSHPGLPIIHIHITSGLNLIFWFFRELKSITLKNLTLQDFSRKAPPESSNKVKDHQHIIINQVWQVSCMQESDQKDKNWYFSLWTRYIGLLPVALQKLAQLDDDKQQHLHDVCCVWLYLLPKLTNAFPSEVIAKYTTLFMKGILGCAINSYCSDFRWPI